MDSNGSSSPLPEQHAPHVSDFAEIIEPLKAHLRSVCIPVLFPGERESKIFDDAFDKEETIESLSKFSLSAEYSVVNIEALANEVVFALDVKMHSARRVFASAAIIKTRDAPLDGRIPFNSQLQLVGMAVEREGDTDEVNQHFFMYLQQLTRHFYAPLSRSAKHNSASLDNEEDDHLVVLQKKIRELDFALEQCQRGTAIPSIRLRTLPSIETSSRSASITILRNYLDKYNSSQVDTLFRELGLAKVMGSDDKEREDFANEVNKMAKLWPAEILKQTRLVDSPFPGSVEKELDFWQEMDRKLQDTKAQLDGGPIMLTKLVLKRTNRVSEQLISEAEIQLDKAIKTVGVSLSFLRDFPIEELLATNSLHPKLSRCIANCLSHFSKLKHSHYDFSRAVRLLEVLGAITLNKIVHILREGDIMQCDIEELRQTRHHCDEVFLAWKTHLSTQRVILKDVAKRRNEKAFAFKFDFDTIQKRINSIVDFREQHDKIVSILSIVLANQEGEFISELNDAYHLILRTITDCFDVSPTGSTAWNSSMQMYEKRLEKVEEHITRILEGRLSVAKSADEMFRIFSMFNPLFFRPTIRNAVNSFRTILVKNVSDDVKRLQDKFRHRYDESLERVTADLRDIPPLSGRIIWARQIENQLSTLMKRIQDVLGVGWEDHLEGKQLKEVCDELRNYLDTSQLYEDWLTQQLKIDTNKYNKLKDFLLLVDEDHRTNTKFLRVNFDEKQVIVFKEVKYLEWLLPSMSLAHKTIPNTIKARSTEAYSRYPIALALQSALTAYNRTKKMINNQNSILLVTHLQQVRDVINEAIGGSKRSKWVKWDSKDLNDWVTHLSVKIYALEERVDDVRMKMTTIDQLLDQLTVCPYDRDSFQNICNSLQSITDELPMKGLSNINLWVQRLDKRAEDIIKDRLSLAIASWTHAFESEDQKLRDLEKAVRKNPTGDVTSTQRSLMSRLEHMKEETVKTVEVEQKLEDVHLEQTVHEIILSNQILFLSPTLEQARHYWMGEFHHYLSVAATLPRIIATRYKVFENEPTDGRDYSDLLSKLDSALLKRPFLVIQKKILAARDHVQQWLQYQALWDASVVVLADKLGKDIGKWQQLLNEIKAARSTIEGVEDERLFGPIVISHRQVSNKINMKYDSWQKESQIRFGIIMLDEIKQTHTDLVAVKSRLESISLDGPTSAVIAGVEFILKTKASMPQRQVAVSLLKSSEKLLQAQRFQFPQEWLPVSNVLGVLGDVVHILERRTSGMEAQLPLLQQQIKEEDAAIAARTDKFIAEWKDKKPKDGNGIPANVLQSLSEMSAQAQKLREDSVRLQGAKEALGMDFVSDDRLAVVDDEIRDLAQSWEAVTPIYNQLAEIKATPMKNLETVKLKKQLEDLQARIQTIPAKLRSYPAVESLQQKVMKHLSYQPVMRDLSTDALKERHWKKLLEKLEIPTTVPKLTVGHIWDSNALANRRAVAEELSAAQGEAALEQFLKDLRESWMGCEVQLIMRDSVKIVIGWEDIFVQLEDNMNSLASLKQSPFFKNVPEFQEDTNNWEIKLTNLHGIFNIWVEVQRKWMYLRGIFRNNDIKVQLPAQYTKFKTVDTEYLSLVKRVAAKPNCLELLKIDNCQQQLEREDATMTLIQKALGEYLERQRQIFPRFYFINNDDLVEIIGNSNEPGKIVVHLGKMFSALSGVELVKNPQTESIDKATHMSSRDGESVQLAEVIDLTIGVKDWLGNLEMQMANTLATLLQDSLKNMPADNDHMLAWIDSYPAQVVILAGQVSWTDNCEKALNNNAQIGDFKSGVLDSLEGRLRALSECVLQDMVLALRKKCEQLLTEMVHQRDVTRQLVAQNVKSNTAFGWLYHLRYYWNPKEEKLMQRLGIRMSNASFFYGFEYLGIGDRLVQTTLTDRCYLTLTQALHFRMGANPFGPAGTGKTESVKMLGAQLGRFVLVFNCDAAFDYNAMGRIFSGLCQVGAWGCFDEFNRLEERMLSAVSQQILNIQKGLLNDQKEIEMLGTPCKLSPDVGIFVTMNPGYAGRSNLPENLKQLFRGVAMSAPDRKMIAQVMLFSQGIVSAESLAGKIVLLFVLCNEQLSLQSHYDFGLRALKSVLVGAGELKRHAMSTIKEGEDMEKIEMTVLIKATCDNIVPKLVSEDINLFNSLMQAVFPGFQLPVQDEGKLIEELKKVCEEQSLVFGDQWVEKVLQLKQVLDIRHGVMLVGPSNTGKTTAWRSLLKALGRVDGIKDDSYVIDPKAIDLKQLYGSLDPNSLEWTDGVFTKLLRKCGDSSSVRGVRRTWIVFDGDVDPEWAENLNSVLDDNKVLTLPSGDRLKVPPNVRIMMEVDTLRHATLATVSRAGMVWFANDTLTLDVMLQQQILSLRREQIDPVDVNSFGNGGIELQKATQQKFIDKLEPMYNAAGIVGIALNYARSLPHVMDPLEGRLLSTLYIMIVRGIAYTIDYNDAHADFPMNDDHLEGYVTKWLLFSLLWAFVGSATNDMRSKFCDVLVGNIDAKLPNDRVQLIDLQPSIEDGGWIEWASLVPRLEIDSNKVSSTNIVITTTDTVRHVEVIKSWLSAHKPLVLCGPPGSGKSMTLTSVLDSSPEYVLAALNFSAGTLPDLILATFAQYCEVVDSKDGLILQPNRATYRENQWLVVFCDECNLPEEDAYGTQVVIMFVREMTEQGGFWNSDCKWVTLRRIQFVGACNPPTDQGRVPMSERFMRHAPLLLVDYPAEQSLKQIYRCFNHAMLKPHPNLKNFVDPLNNAMVDFYLRNQHTFSADMQPQYIYSPRELSRWVRALNEAVEPMDAMTAEELVRLWGHEALRLFSDRLVTEEEREWADKNVDEVAQIHFGEVGVDVDACLRRPMLYTNWIKKVYQSVGREELRNFVAARLKVFYEEVLDVPLVIFDEVLDHVLRIDNVLRHPIGHVLLVGESGVGKTVLTRFVAWMNGLSIFQIKANRNYSLEMFDEDLRTIFRRVGVDGEKMCFIFDESNALSSAFLEKMNALLASGEVPGLFEGEDRVQLLAACRDSFSQKQGLIMDSEDELTRYFTKLIQRNLHVVFTMNPANADFSGRNSTSPALYNRCVVDWFGTWSEAALIQVASEFTRQIDTGFTDYSKPGSPPDMLAMTIQALEVEDYTLSEAIVASLVSMHCTVRDVTIRLGKLTGKRHYLSPRDFLDLIHKFVSTEEEKRSSLAEQQTHIRTGLNKLMETQEQVDNLMREMESKGEILKTKDAEANEKLTVMVEKQNEAEQRKVVAEGLTIELKEQNEKIDIRAGAVEHELADAEPTLLAAKQSVSGIQKKHMDEVRALAKPPVPIQKTMEMVCVMKGMAAPDWKDIRTVIRKDDFLSSILNFDTDSLTPKIMKTVQDNYLSNKEFDAESVNRASKACGPLFGWAKSQIKYALILRNIQPLRNELDNLRKKSEELAVSQKQAVDEVATLEAAIKQYKAEYAQAIRDTESIRTEMEVVKNKCARAVSLLSSLGEEKVRWQATSSSFDEQMSTLIGDNLLAASFLTYGGIFDHKVRKSLMLEWSETLESMGIPFKHDFKPIEYLSNPADHIIWRDFGLPSDELATENAILLERFNRYPLLVDPSGQASNFVLNKYASLKMSTTSFLDPSFMKTLATAIRFGTPLLVNDAEYLDPILNPVLNKEVQKTGGRTLICLGSDEIDFSPRFTIVLVTRNPLARFAPDLCSRVTFINFSVTPASLEAQTLSAVLKTERPDVDKKRNEVLRLQGEQSAKMRELQETLLNKISQVQGAILDDDSVIKTLETIKAESAQLAEEVERTKDVMEELKVVSNNYVPIAVAFASVFFSLQSLADVNFLYQFSLQFFLDIVEKVLSEAKYKGDPSQLSPKESQDRMMMLRKAYFKEVARRVLRGLRVSDQLLFAVRLAQIATHGDADSELTDGEIDLLLRGSAPIISDSNSSTLKKYKDALPNNLISNFVSRQLMALGLLPNFSGLLESLTSDSAAWTTFFTSLEPEKNVPTDFIKSPGGSQRLAILKVMIVRAAHPDRVMYALENYVSSVFGDSFDWRELIQINLQEIVQQDVKASSPLMLCSAPGQDASSKVDVLSTMMKAKLLQVSMGTDAGNLAADKSISQAAKTGDWVLLRNVHLCTDWLHTLEKRLHSFSAHESFRLFLTCEISPKLPTALLRISEVLIYEASTGVKSNIQRFYSTIPSARMDRAPAERGRLYALLAWFNAVVQERLRYAPIGWTKRYEFSEADTACSLNVIDQWVDRIAGGRAHVDPAELPWDALCILLSQSFYGGRVDHPFDQAALDSFINSVFTARNYASQAALAHDEKGNPIVVLPDSLSRAAFETWIKELPDSNSPAWIGLPSTAESQLREFAARQTLANLSALQGEVDHSDDITGGGSGGASSANATLLATMERWLSAVPKEGELPFIDASRTSDAESLPLERCLAREVYKGRVVVAMVERDLLLVKSFVDGEAKMSNTIRDLMSNFTKSVIPKAWNGQYTVKEGTPVSEWIVDLTSRTKALDRYVPLLDREAIKAGANPKCTYWLGGMFNPAAFIRATRQQTATVNRWSLEGLELYIHIGDSNAQSVQDTIVEGLVLEGGSFANGELALSDELRCTLPESKLRWTQKGEDLGDAEYVTFPLYLNASRKDLVTQLLVKSPPGVEKHLWAQRGVAIIMQGAL